MRKYDGDRVKQFATIKVNDKERQGGGIGESRGSGLGKWADLHGDVCI